MRVSVDPHDPDYIGVDPVAHYRVYLDDREVKFAITADDEAGIVISHKVDENGHLVQIGRASCRERVSSPV